MFVQVLVDSLVLGALYALMAVSYGLIFGVIRIVNFAQGELITLGALGAWVAWRSAPAAPLMARVVISIIGGCVVAVCAGLAAERMLFRPLLHRDSPALLGLICSLGLSLFIQNTLRLTVSSSDVSYPQLLSGIAWTIGGATVTAVQLLIVAVSLGLTVVASLFVERTPLGLAIVAVRDNQELAKANGVSVESVLRGVFAMSSFLAAVAGMMIGFYYGVARYDMGFLPGIKAFTACIMGGLGNTRGAAMAGVLLGLVEGFGAAYLSTAYRDGFAFALLVAVLLARPRGLLGELWAR